MTHNPKTRQKEKRHRIRVFKPEQQEMWSFTRPKHTLMRDVLGRFKGNVLCLENVSTQLAAFFLRGWKLLKRALQSF